MRVTMTTAARLTGRAERTIGNWIARGELTAEEAVWVERAPGLGRIWQIDVDALRRAHRAHGGTRWYPRVTDRHVARDGASATAREGSECGAESDVVPAPTATAPSASHLHPPHITARLRQLEAELVWLQRVVRELGERGGSAGVDTAGAGTGEHTVRAMVVRRP